MAEATHTSPVLRSMTTIDQVASDWETSRVEAAMRQAARRASMGIFMATPLYRSFRAESFLTCGLQCAG